MPSAGDEPAAAESAGHTPSGAQAVRGSTLLLVGRVLAIGINFLSQILIVRYLAKSDFGAFAYGLSIVALFKGLALFGLPDTVARFLPIYREEQRLRTLTGTVALAVGVVLAVGVLFAGSIATVLWATGERLIQDDRARTLTVVLAFLIPLEALSDLTTSMFAAFGKSRSIFFRRSLLAPVLRLLVVVLLILFNAGVIYLAIGYVLSGLIGLLLYAGMFARMFQTEVNDTDAGSGRQSLRTLDYPVREILGFAMSLLATALVWVLAESFGTILLGYFDGSSAVADFRAVLPVARFNQLVILNFAVLFTPLAARAFARNNHDDVATLYWQTSLWITVLTFPVFLLTFAFSQPLVVTLFGDAYAGSARLLSILGGAYFFHSALGFNGLTLKVYRKIRYSLTIDICVAVLNVVLCLILIPMYGTTGVGVATAATLVVHNLLKQAGLWFFTSVPVFGRTQLRVYGTMAVLAGSVYALQQWLALGILPALAITALASLVVLFVAIRSLQLELMFPELLRIKAVRAVLRPFVRLPA